MKKLTYPALNRLEFAICGSNYVTFEDELFPDIGILDFDTWKNNRQPVKEPG